MENILRVGSMNGIDVISNIKLMKYQIQRNSKINKITLLTIDYWLCVVGTLPRSFKASGGARDRAVAIRSGTHSRNALLPLFPCRWCWAGPRRRRRRATALSLPHTRRHDAQYKLALSKCQTTGTRNKESMVMCNQERERTTNHSS